jgi:hypothetical protein
MKEIPWNDWFPSYWDLARAMIFVDGENLAIRYAAMLKERGEKPSPDMVYDPGILVWSKLLNPPKTGTPAVMRKYYYTALKGDEKRIEEIEARLKDTGIETPRVFKKAKDKGSKRVDITLSTDMLLHATRKHYDVAILVAGDEDYVPLVRAIQGEGARVNVAFVSNGLSPTLRMVADEYIDLDQYMFD